MNIDDFNSNQTKIIDDNTLSIKKGKDKVIVISCCIIIISLLMFGTNLCSYPVGIILRVFTAFLLMANIRWIRWFFIVTGFLSALSNTISALYIYSAIGTTGGGMIFPQPTGSLGYFDFIYCLLLGISNLVFAILLVSNKDIKAYYQNLTYIALNKKISKMAPDERAMVFNQITGINPVIEIDDKIDINDTNSKKIT